ncbi:hypothetical protein [Arthrobacter sp. NPDC092385]|uniref:DUF7793 family protein n=1 Tax=Arthrobacter sp. NPDC092385 TaxID=3363943 RepID=UPI0037FB6747
MLGPGVVRLTWAPGTAVRECDAAQVVERIVHLLAGAPYAILIDVREIVSMSLKAHHVFARDPLVLAAGMLGSGPMDRMLSAGSEQASHPAQYFLSELEAIRWLRSHLPVAPNPLPTSPTPKSPHVDRPAA